MRVGQIFGEVGQVGEAAAEDDGVGVEEVGDGGERPGEAVGVAGEGGGGLASPAAARAGSSVASRASGPSHSWARAGPER